MKLPLYEPDMPCSGLTNANIEYSFVQDPPEWLSLDQETREVKVEIADSNLKGGQSITMLMRAILIIDDGSHVSHDFTFTLIIHEDQTQDLATDDPIIDDTDPVKTD